MRHAFNRPVRTLLRLHVQVDHRVAAARRGGQALELRRDVPGGLDDEGPLDRPAEGVDVDRAVGVGGGDHRGGREGGWAGAGEGVGVGVPGHGCWGCWEGAAGMLDCCWLCVCVCVWSAWVSIDWEARRGDAAALGSVDRSVDWSIGQSSKRRTHVTRIARMNRSRDVAVACVGWVSSVQCRQGSQPHRRFRSVQTGPIKFEIGRPIEDSAQVPRSGASNFGFALPNGVSNQSWGRSIDWCGGAWVAWRL